MPVRGFWVLAVAGLGMTGCGGFFPPLTTTTTPNNPATPSGNADLVYVANGTVGTVAGFVVGTSSAGAGTLTAVPGSPVGLAAIGQGVTLTPTAMAITPANSFLYVAGLGGIYGYGINGTTGALTATNSGGVLGITLYPAVSMDVSPDGKWLFALSEVGETLYEFAINATTGALTPQDTKNFAPADGSTVLPTMVRMAPNGGYVALALGTGGEFIWPFTTSTGLLGSFQSIGTGSVTSSDNAVAFDSGSTYLYVARSGTQAGVVVYSIGAGGVLTSVAGSPFVAGAGPHDLLLDSTGKYLYVANRAGGTISAFTTSAGGVLGANAGSTVASGSLVNSLARDNSGKYVLAAAIGGAPDLTMYNFDGTVAGKLDLAVSIATGIDPAGAVVVVASR